MLTTFFRCFTTIPFHSQIMSKTHTSKPSSCTWTSCGEFCESPVDGSVAGSRFHPGESYLSCYTSCDFMLRLPSTKFHVLQLAVKETSNQPTMPPCWAAAEAVRHFLFDTGCPAQLLRCGCPNAKGTTQRWSMLAILWLKPCFFLGILYKRRILYEDKRDHETNRRISSEIPKEHLTQTNS